MDVVSLSLLLLFIIIITIIIITSTIILKGNPGFPSQVGRLGSGTTRPRSRRRRGGAQG